MPRLIAMPHCHAPVCLSLELYVQCRYRQITTPCGIGMGTRYSSSTNNNIGTGEQKYDGEGFIAISQCLVYRATSLHCHNPISCLSIRLTLMSIIIKRANSSTFPHTREMASWQIRGLVIPKTATLLEGASVRIKKHEISIRF